LLGIGKKTENMNWFVRLRPLSPILWVPSGLFVNHTVGKICNPEDLSFGYTWSFLMRRYSIGEALRAFSCIFIVLIFLNQKAWINRPEISLNSELVYHLMF